MQPPNHYMAAAVSLGDAAVFVMKKNVRKLTKLQLAVFLLLPLIMVLLGLCFGRLMLSPVEVFSALFGGGTGQSRTVVLSMRLPRLLMACAVGTGLSVAGCTFQNLFANPLATPDTLGVASGASFGAALAMLIGFRLVGIQLLSMVFGIAAVAITGLMGSRVNQSRSTPILAGIMVGSLFNSLLSLAKFTADTDAQLPAITYWLMGSMETAGYSTLLLGVPPIVICTVILLLLRWRMNLLPLGEDEAVSTGVNLPRLRRTAQLCAAILTASCISMCGQVGWVGLIVPHLCRMRYGSSNVVLLPACVSMGMSFMVVVDTLARTLSPKEIPISVLTALVGAPFFLYLLKKYRRWTV